MDDLYRSEFDAFEEDGIVTVFRAFSQAPSDTHDCRYVQDRLRREKEIVKKLWDQDAVIFVCGGMKMNNGVKETLLCQVCSSDVELSSPRYVAEVFT